ncbi:Txe/YoeB family addiction module toxin [Sphingobacterium faecium]|uniref:Txe/YoeB family addiction module toxin n=1 Tax=Sphingobacterium faecium TaxID=34087 RepID=UPI00320B726E
MEIFFNELSIKPLSSNKEESKEKINSLLIMMKALREFNITVLRADENFWITDLGDEFTLSHFLNDPSISFEIKVLLQSIIVYPFIRDEADEEVDSYINNSFKTKDHEGNIKTCEGIAAGYLFNSPTLSLSSHCHWSQDELVLEIDYDQGETLYTNVLNLSIINYLDNSIFTKQLELLKSIPRFRDAESIYKVYSKDEFLFEDRAVQDIVSWVRDDIRYIIKIMSLIEDIKSNPLKGGLGKTEILKHDLKGKCSKRIVKKDRLIYTYTKELITIHKCREHYN